MNTFLKFLIARRKAYETCRFEINRPAITSILSSVLSLASRSLVSLSRHTLRRAIFLHNSQAVHQQHLFQDVSARASTFLVLFQVGRSRDRRQREQTVTFFPQPLPSVSLHKRTAPGSTTTTHNGGCATTLGNQTGGEI